MQEISCFFSSPEPKAQGELIVWDLSRRPSVRPCVRASTLSKMNISETRAALPRGATGLSAVCNCGISWSYSLTIYNGRNVVTTLVLSILNGSSSFLQTIRTTIKAWMSLNFVKIPSYILELASLEHLKN